MTEILFAAIHLVVFAFLISGVLLCLQRAENRRARIYLAIFMFITAGELAYRLYVAYRTRVVTMVDEVLPIYVLVTSVGEILLMYLYPLEVLKPGWVTAKRLFLLFLPWLFVGGVCILIYPDFRNLSSFSDMMQHLDEFNVWFRMLILLGCVVPYTILLLCIPYKWQQSSVDRTWIYKYAIGVQVIGVLFVVVILTGSVLGSSIHLLYGTLFVLYVVYQELFLRLLPTAKNQESQVAIKITPDDDSMQRDDVEVCNPLWERFSIQMTQKELWRNPDLTLDDLARSLCTNRTTLSTQIQQQGYSGYYEFINRRRIEAFTEAVNRGSSVNMQQLFYEVGYRSRSTATRNFRLYMKCTPGEYIQRTIEQKMQDVNSDSTLCEE